MEKSRTTSLLWIIIAFLVGLLVGWLVLGWVVAPVSYTNALLGDLRPEDQQIFLEAVAESYQTNGDAALARDRLRRLGTPEEVGVLAGQAVEDALQTGDRAAAQRIQDMAAAVGLTITAPEPGQQQPATGEQQTSALQTVCLTGLGLLVVLGGIALAVWLLTKRSTGEQGDGRGEEELDLPPPTADTTPPSQPKPTPAAATSGDQQAVMEYVATYQMGDTAYDESFDIEAPRGGYLGECGMTLSEFVNGDPSRATALEVWLFDKSDIRTVTTVLMSEFAHANHALRDKMASRGEAALVTPDLTFQLDAETLRLEGQVVSLRYAEGDGPPNSTIEQISVRLRVISQGA